MLSRPRWRRRSGCVHTRFRPSSADRRRTAATELDGDQRPRPGLVWGEVHDGNAYALGRCGRPRRLVRPALGDMARFVQALLGPEAGRLLSAESIASDGHPSRRPPALTCEGLGWRLGARELGDLARGDHLAHRLHRDLAAGRPGAGTGVVLLTNSVHPYRRLEDQAAVRAEIHRLVAEALL